MAKIANKTKEKTLKGEQRLNQQREKAAEQLDSWRKEHKDTLKDWNGTKIIRHFRDKR